MQVIGSTIAFKETGYFSKLVQDYLAGSTLLEPFYEHMPTLEGIKASIAARKNFPTDRARLVAALREQYQGLSLSASQERHLQLLHQPNTFTITTAHQPNIFTGPLYFIYKILHVAKLAAELQVQLPDYHFVPVYYMGSEDADLEELGFIHLGGEKLVWQTQQTGAVGRMLVDDAFIQLLHTIYGQIGITEHGQALVQLFRSCYTKGTTIQAATLALVTTLFAEYGVLTLVPDQALLKQAFTDIVAKELQTQFSHTALQNTNQAFGQHYAIQTEGRVINGFYLLDHQRIRIDWQDGAFHLADGCKSWSAEALLSELHMHPERFSPNVVLRGVFQETILPNIVFVGGGGELAYWLQLKQVFQQAGVPYPVLMLRNSFLVIDPSLQALMQKLQISISQLFQPTLTLQNNYVQQHTTHQLQLQQELVLLQKNYQTIAQLATAVDASLQQHVAKLQTQMLHKLQELEKKMLRAEKRKHEAGLRQIEKLKQQLFPHKNLQERVDNLAKFYALYGPAFLQSIYAASTALESSFQVLQIKAC